MAKTPGGLRLYLQLSMLALAGPLYIDVLPAIINALIGGLGMSPKQAGAIAAANGYASTVSALLAVVILRRLPWRPIAAVLLIFLIISDVASAVTTDFFNLLLVRIVHGLSAGVLVGLSYALIARTASRSDGFGILFVLHFGFAGMGVILSTWLGHYLGTGTIFMITSAFSLLALSSLVTIPDLETSEAERRLGPNPFVVWRGKSWQIAAAVGALFLFQASNIGLGAFLIGIGQRFGHSPDFAGFLVGGGLFAGALGSLFMLGLIRHFNKIGVLAVGLVAIACVKCLLFTGEDPIFYAVAVVGSYFAMACALPLLYAQIAEFDRSGEAAALGGFAAKFGLSCGPLVGAYFFNVGIGWLIAASIAGALFSCILSLYAFRENAATSALNSLPDAVS